MDAGRLVARGSGIRRVDVQLAVPERDITVDSRALAVSPRDLKGVLRLPIDLAVDEFDVALNHGVRHNVIGYPLPVNVQTCSVFQRQVAGQNRAVRLICVRARPSIAEAEAASLRVNIAVYPGNSVRRAAADRVASGFIFAIDVDADAAHRHCAVSIGKGQSVDNQLVPIPVQRWFVRALTRDGQLLGAYSQNAVDARAAHTIVDRNSRCMDPRAAVDGVANDRGICISVNVRCNFGKRRIRDGQIAPYRAGICALD